MDAIRKGFRVLPFLAILSLSLPLYAQTQTQLLLVRDRLHLGQHQGLISVNFWSLDSLAALSGVLDLAANSLGDGLPHLGPAFGSSSRA